MKTYEITYLTPSEETIDAKVVAPTLQEHAAVIKSVHPWGGRRKLVYPIKKQDQAFYTTVVFDAEPSAIAPLERAFHLHNDVIRSLIVEYEPGYFERQNQPSDESSQQSRPAPAAAKPAKEETPAPTVTEAAETEPPETAPAETVTAEVDETAPTADPEATSTKKPTARKSAKKAETKQEETSLDEKLDALLKEDITK